MPGRFVLGSLAVGVALLAVVATGGGAAPPVRFSISVSTHRLSYPTGTAALTITMTTGNSAQTAAVGLSQSGWPDRQVYGSPIAFGAPHISGAGRISGGWASSGFLLFGVPPLCVRGPLIDGESGVDVALPANSVTTLSYTVRLATPPWPGVRPTIGAFVSVPAINPGGSFHTIGTARLTAGGRTGVRIALTSRPIVLRGATARISGTTDPRAANAQVRLSAQTYTNPRLLTGLRRIPIGTTTTRHDGTFAIDWEPGRHGAYRITATLPSATRTHFADRGCDLSLVAR